MRANLLVVFKGFCMGIADVIPGVSGGTIAFLMGIYDELLAAVASFDARFLRELSRGRVRAAFAGTGWRFLALLGTGILGAIFTLSHLIKHLLEHHPVPLHALFLGLIVMTVPVVLRKMRTFGVGHAALFAGSTVAMFHLVGMVPLQTPEATWFLFLAGALAICAMILPGISGAFILLLLGKYEFVLVAVTERNLAVLAVVAAGCATGLLSFVRLLKWLLVRWHDATLAALAGLVLGSLRKIWPWKETLSTTTLHGKLVPLEQANILPDMMTGSFALALLLFASGCALSLWLASFDDKKG